MGAIRFGLKALSVCLVTFLTAVGSIAQADNNFLYVKANTPNITQKERLAFVSIEPAIYESIDGIFTRLRLILQNIDIAVRDARQMNSEEIRELNIQAGTRDYQENLRQVGSLIHEDLQVLNSLKGLKANLPISYLVGGQIRGVWAFNLESAREIFEIDKIAKLNIFSNARLSGVLEKLKAADSSAVLIPDAWVISSHIQVSKGMIAPFTTLQIPKKSANGRGLSLSVKDGVHDGQVVETQFDIVVSASERLTETNKSFFKLVSQEDCDGFLKE